MSAEKSFTVILEPNRTVYVDTDDEAIAFKIAMHVRQRAGEVVGATSAEPPKIERRMADPNLLDTSQEYEETKYWVVSRQGAK